MLLRSVLVSHSPSNHSLEKLVARTKNWPAVIERLNHNPKGELKIRMGSPGSAQVTRCRLLAEWSNLEATTVGSTLILRIPSKR